MTFDVEPQHGTVSHASHLADKPQFIFGGISQTKCPAKKKEVNIIEPSISDRVQAISGMINTLDNLDDEELIAAEPLGHNPYYRNLSLQAWSDKTDGYRRENPNGEDGKTLFGLL